MYTALLKLLEKITPKRKRVLIACFMKSGSSFLLSALLNITGFKKRGYVYTYERNEQDIEGILVFKHAFSNSIVQQHARATDNNVFLIKLFSIKTIVLVRNLFDVVVSIRDHIYNISVKMPMAHVDESFFKLNKEKQYDYIIELILPWYFSFYNSWYRLSEEGDVDVHWVTYEELMKNKLEKVGKILDFIGLKKNGLDISKNVSNTNKKSTLFNKGVSGRGKKELTKAQIEKINKYADFFPGVDFSRILK